MRERRQRGFRCETLEICDADVSGLIALGLLDRIDRDDPSAVNAAIGRLLGRLATRRLMLL